MRLTRGSSSRSWPVFPRWQPDGKPALIIFGDRDIPEIAQTCKELRQQGVRGIEIDQALHNDIFLNEETINRATEQLRAWFNMPAVERS